MYAVVRSGGKQYRVEEGTVLTVDRLEAEPGSTVTLEDVVLLSEGDELTAGGGVRVTAEVVGATKGEKIRVLKYKNKVRYHKLTGARAKRTRIRITKIEAEAEA